MKTVKLCSSTLSEGTNQSIFLYKTATKLLLSCMRARRWQPIYLWSEGALSFIHHFWSVFITFFWLGQINCVWGSLHVLATESCVLDLVLVSFSEAVYLWVTLLFKPKQQCTRRWLTLPRCILNQINKTYTCTCLGYEFCFQQHDNLTRQSYFFKPLSTYLGQNKNPGCYWFFFFVVVCLNNQLLFFRWEQC